MSNFLLQSLCYKPLCIRSNTSAFFSSYKLNLAQLINNIHFLLTLYSTCVVDILFLSHESFAIMTHLKHDLNIFILLSFTWSDYSERKEIISLTTSRNVSHWELLYRWIDKLKLLFINKSKYERNGKNEAARFSRPGCCFLKNLFYSRDGNVLWTRLERFLSMSWKLVVGKSQDK